MTEPITTPTGEPPAVNVVPEALKPTADKAEKSKRTAPKGDSDGGKDKGPNTEAPKPTADKDQVKADEVRGGYALLYLGQKKEKTVDLECACGNTYTFVRESAKAPARAVIDCPDCYSTLMNTAGPGVANIEDVIFVPPHQHKAFLAAKRATAAARDAALRDFKQPWRKDGQVLEAHKGEE